MKKYGLPVWVLSSVTAGPQGLPTGLPVSWLCRLEKHRKFSDVMGTGRGRQCQLPGNCAQNPASNARSNGLNPMASSAKAVAVCANAWRTLSAVSS